MRVGVKPIRFIGRKGFQTPEQGCIMMVVTPPILINKKKRTPNATETTEITVQLLWNEEVIFAEWDYSKHGFMAFFNLKYSPETDDE